MNLNVAEVRRVGLGNSAGVVERGFLFPGPPGSGGPLSPISPRRRIPGEGFQLPRTGLSSFTLLAASPISSQKVPNSSLESLQLPKLAIFSSSPQLF